MKMQSMEVFNSRNKWDESGSENAKAKKIRIN